MHCTIHFMFLRKEHADNATTCLLTPWKLLIQTKLGDTHHSLEVNMPMWHIQLPIHILVGNPSIPRKPAAGINIFQSGENPVT